MYVLSKQQRTGVTRYSENDSDAVAFWLASGKVIIDVGHSKSRRASRVACITQHQTPQLARTGVIVLAVGVFSGSRLPNE